MKRKEMGKASEGRSQLPEDLISQESNVGRHSLTSVEHKGALD